MEFEELKEGENEEKNHDKVKYPIDLKVISQLQKVDTNLIPIWERLVSGSFCVEKPQKLVARLAEEEKEMQVLALTWDTEGVPG
uniref:Uncharacterized protein n=1 Tax=Romanomermis culicivorax TaxID=13658 RepID=A0A915JMC8_ROMCU